ncbi:hypothetical protein EU527_08950 [Candidatus Thorarchaeota archaeon]|nr:MAG: hypothetical protein EU527_08950 [Candidatus Thorarchaeota archaeon]
MRHFLILFDNIPIDKASLKAGFNSPELVTACRCINVGLFISGNLRRDVTISIALGAPHDLQIISFPGDTLRRVSPDERSISFFLFKSIKISTELLHNTSKTLDNGIIIQRMNINDIFGTVSPNNFIVAKENEQKTIDYLGTDVLLFYDNRVYRTPLISSELLNYRTVTRPPHPERFILDINRAVDNAQENT